LEPDELPRVERPGGPCGERVYSVRRGELDINGHVNHTVCFDWVTESIPDEVFDDCEPAALDAEYLSSIPRTDVEVRTERQPGEPARFLHSVAIRETGKEAARLSTEWRRVGAAAKRANAVRP
jgi:acyl-ACP thioesterase